MKTTAVKFSMGSSVSCNVVSLSVSQMRLEKIPKQLQGAAFEWTECTSAGKQSQGGKGLVPLAGVQIARELNDTR